MGEVIGVVTILCWAVAGCWAIREGVHFLRDPFAYEQEFIDGLYEDAHPKPRGEVTNLT